MFKIDNKDTRAENFTSVKGVEKSRIIGSLSSPAED